MVYKIHNQGDANIEKYHPSNGKRAVILDYKT